MGVPEGGIWGRAAAMTALPPKHWKLSHSIDWICSATNWLPRVMASLATDPADSRTSTPGLMTMKATVSQNAERRRNIISKTSEGDHPDLGRTLAAGS
jgi:hypothetical protein